MKWNKIDVNICNSGFFKRVILILIRPEPNQVFDIESTEGLKFLTRIRFGLSHLADHKFRTNFQDCVNPICSCGQEIEASIHFLLHCSNYHFVRQPLFKKYTKLIQLLKSKMTKL